MIIWRELRPHVINQFPAMQEWEFTELVKSIEDGYDDRHPIYVFKGDEDSEWGIIDGANRHRACLETGVIPTVKEFYGSYEDAMKFIMRTNTRRNLTAGQKAAVVLDMDGIVSKLVEEASKKFQGGFNQHVDTGDHKLNTAKSLGDMAGVGSTTVKHAQKVKQHDPELYSYVKSGQVSAKSAYNQIQDKIADGDLKLSQQRTAKSILKNAIQVAIDEAKDELYNEALNRVENSESNNVSFKLKLTLV